MELFDVLNIDGTKTGKKKERNAVHTDGDWHGSVHIWIIRDGKILLQKRNKSKDSFPNCFDIASTGHIDAGETQIESALRELKEELNITAKEFDFVPLFTQKLIVKGNFQNKNFISNEINYVFFLKNTVNLNDLRYQESEIEYLKWFNINELKKEIKNEKFCIKNDEFIKVLDFYNNL